MNKRILYLTFYFEPDLCAGSFRNTPLVKELSKQLGDNGTIDVFTTMPNRYHSYKTTAKENEKQGNISIRRINISSHKSNMWDQAISFNSYARKILKETKEKEYDLVFASSSRLFTAWLGYRIAKRNNTPLYLDLRDIFYDTLDDIFKKSIIKRSLILPFVKQIEKSTYSYARHINLISHGFQSYFEEYKQANYSSFTNGIDDIFLNITAPSSNTLNKPQRIVYAGNIGSGQGLDKIIPEAAKRLGAMFEFVIIGDGGKKQDLLNKIEELEIGNVKILNPVSRESLIDIYKEADYTFIHLNDFKAFEKVLPSKIFELACFSQPMIAGVGGYAGNFIKENIENKILFSPCDVDDLVHQLQEFSYKREDRKDFISKYRRSTIDNEMAKSIISYL